MRVMHKQIEQKKQAGFVSLTVALTLVIILALLTVGFAQLSRREQQQALTKQLSVQAFYSAESGINDAYQAIKDGVITSSTPYTDGSRCIDIPGASAPSKTINAAAGSTYNCLLVNLRPPTLEYTKTAPESDHRSTFSTDQPLGNLKISWNSTYNNNNFLANTANGFGDSSSWTTAGRPPVLEFTLSPIPNNFTQADLIKDSFTIYLYPSTNGPNSIDYATIAGNPPAGADQGTIVPGSCSAATHICSVTIGNILNGAGFNYLIRFVTHYDTADVSISGTTPGGVAVRFVDGQASIDVTGKAQDVLRRERVRVPLKDNPDLPKYAAEGQNICKHFTTTPSNSSFLNPDETGASPGTSNACYLSD